MAVELSAGDPRISSARRWRTTFRCSDKYPHYIFNFTGARRYMFMRSITPEDYAKLKTYIAAGKWFPAGSTWMRMM